MCDNRNYDNMQIYNPILTNCGLPLANDTTSLTLCNKGVLY